MNGIETEQERRTEYRQETRKWLINYRRKDNAIYVYDKINVIKRYKK